MFPRVLLSLNVLDEFGFRPGTDPDNYYLGNPGMRIILYMKIY